MYTIRNYLQVSNAFRYIFPKNCVQLLAGDRPYSTIPNKSRQYSLEDGIQFKNVFPEITADFLDQIKKYENDGVADWFEKSLWYNVNGGKLNRGHLTVIAYKLLADKSQLTAENIKQAQYVGWMSEMLEAALLIIDDIIDRSTTRRNLPCWYTLPGVKMQSIHDSLMLENGAFLGLKKYIGHKDYYPKIFQLFSEAMFCTYLGQMLDFNMSKENVTNQTMDRFENIIQYATCYPGMYLPIALALEMCGYKDSKIYEDCKKFSLAVGLFWQSRNDYWDCFGDVTETGKEGNDIMENKLSWLAVNAVAQADLHQRKILQTCYGQKDPEKVAQVLALYKEMGIDQKFLQHEKDSYGRINKILELSCDNIKPLLQTMWDTIYYKIKLVG